MNLPISPGSLLGSVAVIRDATRLAGNVVREVGQAIGFDELLRGPSGQTPADLKPDTVQLVRSIRQRLRSHGIEPNPPLVVRVTPGGRMRVDRAGDGPAGETERLLNIERLLNSDPQLVRQASELQAASGTSDASIDLTIAADEENILNAPGGYPNW